MFNAVELPRLEALRSDAGRAVVEGRLPEGKGGHISVDGILYRISDIDAPLTGQHGYGYNINETELTRLGRHLDVETFTVKGLRTTTLDPLLNWRRIEGLRLWWVQKLTDLSPLARMQSVRRLILEDVKQVSDLRPLASMVHLEALSITGGMWADQTVDTLDPLAALQDLEELCLGGLKIGQGGLRPIARCAALKRFAVSYKFETADYAYLAAKMPGLACTGLQATVRVPSPIDGKDVMVVGKRKPYLNSQKDAARIARYQAEFAELVADFRADPKA